MWAARARPGLDADKLLITSRALRLRRDHPDWFAGTPTSRWPPAAPAAGHALAFARGGAAVTVATRLPAGLRDRGGWAGTVLPMPAVAAGCGRVAGRADRNRPSGPAAFAASS